MVQITLLPVRKLVHQYGSNSIIQSYKENSEIKNFEYVSTSPFILQCNNEFYFLSSKIDEVIPDECNYGLLTSRKPTRRDFNRNTLKIKRWIKHPSFVELSPEQIVETWRGNFSFIKEDVENGIKGLRPPQLGALYSILAHFQNAEEKGIVVMPTGTGKTETMLSALIANQCNKLLVAVPSDALRGQISNKFIGLGLLKEFSIVDKSCQSPIVGIMNQKIGDNDILADFISKSNVVVTTMDILTGSSSEQKFIYSDTFSHFFIDEAHHSRATTWENLIKYFDKKKVLLFTATPYRNDGKKLDGKFIFNFSLRQAQKQGYYKEIKFLPIREYEKREADIKIAEKAVAQLREDMGNGYGHIIMARCVSKNRALEVFEHYQKYEDLNPVMVHTGIAGLKDKIEAIKKGQHRIIVCVNMLGEGFDLPELKIAAIHDERQSIPITVQFVGRFTRTSYEELGQASVITNIAYPPIQQELNQLHSRDADWNLLLPLISEEATDKEINFQNFLEGFDNLDNSNIPFQSINPAMSSVIYRVEGNEWNPNNWREGIPNIDSYEHQFSDHNNERATLVIILGKVMNVEWGSFDVVKNMEWSMIVINWDLRPDRNLVFVHTSSKNISTDKLVEAIFSEEYGLIKGMDVFKIFHDVKRLTLYNVGARKGVGKDISFQSFFGRGVQDGLNQLEQGTLVKNNIFGVGFKNGEKVSLGCSVKGKIWSQLRGNINELTEWCKSIGEILINPDINPNTVLENTLIPVTVYERPQTTPISVDWDPIMYKHSENKFTIIIDGSSYDLSNSELSIIESPINEPLKFSYVCEDYEIIFEALLGSRIINGVVEAFYEFRKLSVENPIVSFSNRTLSLSDFFQRYAPTIWFADGSQLIENNHIKPKQAADVIPLENILTDNWDDVSINKEAQGIYPFIQDSIQYYFINKVKDNFQIIYDDDGRGEIADIIGINNEKEYIDIHLFHLKYAKNGRVGNDIGNFYEVCGQAQKSLNWKYRDGRMFFDHLLRRKTKTKNQNTCSRIIKGTEKDLEQLLNAAKWTKEMKFHIYIVQPSLAKANASDDILLLLGNTHHYLHTLGNVELLVYTS